MTVRSGAPPVRSKGDYSHPIRSTRQTRKPSLQPVIQRTSGGFQRKVNMTRRLTPQSSLELLKREAKRWLKALEGGDTKARDRLARALTNPPENPTLRDVQLALAREHGLPGWAALKQAAQEMRAGHTPRDGAQMVLFRAASEGDATRVAAVLDEYPDLVDERGATPGTTGVRTALHYGVHHEAVVRVLLERCADPNVRDTGDDAMPLHFAAER